jgi:hypothetical protein
MVDASCLRCRLFSIRATVAQCTIGKTKLAPERRSPQSSHPATRRVCLLSMAVISKVMAVTVFVLSDDQPRAAIDAPVAGQARAV